MVNHLYSIEQIIEDLQDAGTDKGKGLIVIDKTVTGGLIHLDSPRINLMRLIREFHLPYPFLIPAMDMLPSQKDLVQYPQSLIETFDNRGNSLFPVVCEYCKANEVGHDTSQLANVLTRNGKISQLAQNVLNAAKMDHLHPGSMAALRIATHLADESDRDQTIYVISRRIGGPQIIPTIVNPAYAHIVCMSPDEFIKRELDRIHSD